MAISGQQVLSSRGSRFWLVQILRKPQDDSLLKCFCVFSRLRVGRRSESGGVDGDDDGFGGRRVAFVCHAVDGDEDIGFGEIGRRAGSGNGVGDHDKLWCCSGLTVVVTDDIHQVAFR